MEPLVLDPPARFRRDATAARISAACDAARRRLERDLHDGAQQRLVSLSLRLRLVGSRLDPGSEAEAMLTAAQAELAEALQELRDLARGLHPAVLTDHGLEPALESLTARAPLPVRLDVRVPTRLANPVEVAAYYVVSEALANIGKHAAEATHAHVTVTAADDDRLVVTIADDGAGGADATKGSGLQGLADRVSAQGGRLDIADALPTGTVIRAEMPLTSRQGPAPR